MDEYKIRIIQQIINCDSTLEIISLMKKHCQLLDDVQIIFFDEKASNFTDFEDKAFGRYYVCGIADYNKCWIIDNQNTKFELKVYKRAFFDLNIISRIDNLFRGKFIEDKADLMDLLTHVKDNKYDLQIGNSILERMSKSYDEMSFRRSMESFYEYLEIEHFGDRLPVGFENSKSFDDFYKQCKRVGLMSNDAMVQLQYNFLLCLFIKAILIKADKNITNKADELIKFSLNELKCLMINELYLLCLYFKNDVRVDKTFAKFHTSISGGLEKAVKNSVWDIYHARLIEQEMFLYEKNTNEVCLPYFITNDRGVKDYWDLNPRKMVVLIDGNARIVYSHNVNDLESELKDTTLFDEMIDVDLAYKRKREINSVDINGILDQLLLELNNVNI